MGWSWGGAGGGALSGAQMGSSFGPWGTVIGGVAGGLIGAFTGGKKKAAQNAPGGAYGIDPFEILNQYAPSLLSGGQEQDIVNRLLTFNDLPTSPLGVASRDTLMDRLDPNFVPQFFRNDVLNPFLNAQFRLGREQMGKDTEAAEAQFQRLGAYFTPDLPQFTQQIRERQNLNEQDFLGNLGFQGAQIAEQLRTDAIARALGLETQTANVLDQLQARQAQRINQQLGFLTGGNIGDQLFGPQPESTNPLGFIAGGGLNNTISGLFNGQGGQGGIMSLFSNNGQQGGGGWGSYMSLLSQFMNQNQSTQNKQSFFPQ